MCAQVTDNIGEFPVVHPMMHGVKTRYTWMGISDKTDRKGRFNGLLKMDLSVAGSSPQQSAVEVCVGRVDFGPGCYGGEAVFVPRHEDPAQCKGE